MTITAGWYERNAARGYPLLPTSTAKDDSGNFLPENLIADLRLRFSDEANARAFISYAAVGKVVSVVISVQKDAVIKQVAIFSAPRTTVNTGVIYPLTSLDLDAQGHIVFGDVHPATDYTLRFSGASQTGLSTHAAYPQAASSYARRFGIMNQRPMKLYPLYALGQNDVVIEPGQRTLAGQASSSVVFGLAASTNDAGGRNLLAEYAGQCGQRPESKTCNSPQPLENINGVQPDCCGRIFIELRGCGDMYPLNDRCGIVIVCPFTTEQACPKPVNVPDAQGRLPNEYASECDLPVAPETNQNATPPPKWWELLE